MIIIDHRKSFMNLLIVEDNLYFQKKVKNVLMQSYPGSSITLVDRLGDIEKNHSSFDICFMDIELPDGDGIEFLKKYPNRFPAVVYFTSHEDRVYEAFGKNIYGFIPKSNEYFEQKMLDILKKIPGSRFIHVTDENGRHWKIDLDKIIFVQTDQRKLILQLVNQSLILKRQPIREFAQVLDQQFIWINQSTLINMKYINAWKKEEVIMINGHILYASRRFAKEACHKYLESTYVHS